MRKNTSVGLASVGGGLVIDGLHLGFYQAQNDGIIIPSKLFCFPSDLTAEQDGRAGQDTQDDAACVEIWDSGLLDQGHSQEVFRIIVPPRWRYQEFDSIRIESSRHHGGNESQLARRETSPSACGKTSHFDRIGSKCGPAEFVNIRRDILLSRERSSPWGP